MDLFGASIALALLPRIHELRAVEPIPTRNHRTVDLVFGRIPFLTTPLSYGEREISVRWTQANEFRSFGRAQEDSEISAVVTRWRWGGRDGELLVEAPLISRGSGVLDPLITGWHQTFLKFVDPARASTRANRVRVRLGSEYDVGSATGWGDVTMVGSKPLTDQWSVRGMLKLPTGTAGQMLGSGAVDLGIGLSYRARFARQWELATMASLIWQGKATKLPRSQPWVEQLGLMIAYAPNSRDAWIAQLEQESSGIRTRVRELDQPQRQSTFGFRRQVGRGQALDLYFSEDGDFLGALATTAPDFTVGVRWSYRF